MSRLAALWKIFNKPSHFARDPYGGFLNQLGHYSGGAGVFIFACCLVFAVNGEMPSRDLMACALIFVYALVVEWRVQGWRGKDTVEDILFVSCGILTVATSVREVGFGGWVSVIELSVASLTAAMAMSLAACLVYALVRVPKEKEE